MHRHVRLSRVCQLHVSSPKTTSLPTVAMAGLEADDQTKEARLKAALWYAMGKTIDAVAVAQDINATPHFIGGLSEMVRISLV